MNKSRENFCDAMMCIGVSFLSAILYVNKV
jgi:hypothetical protein